MWHRERHSLLSTDAACTSARGWTVVPEWMGQCLWQEGAQGGGKKAAKAGPGVGLDRVHLLLPVSLARLSAPWRHAALHRQGTRDTAGATHVPWLVMYNVRPHF